MPVTLQDPINASIANGVTTVFPYHFLIPSADALTIEIDGVEVPSGYTVSGVGNAAGGNITFAVAPVDGAGVVRYRDLDAKRDFDWAEGGDLLAETHDANDDYAIMLIQQLMEQGRRTPKLPRGHGLSSSDITLPVPGAGQYIRWNLLGLALEAVDAVVDLGNYLASGVGAVLRTVLSKLGDRITPQDYGCLGGATDDTVNLQKALDAAEGRVLEFLTMHTITAPVDLPEGITIKGSGGVHVDCTLANGVFAILGIGTVGAAVPLTADVLTTDEKVVVASTASFVGASHVAISDKRYSAAGAVYPTVIVPISELSGGTDINTLTPINVAYLIIHPVTLATENAYARPIFAKRNINIESLRITFSAAANVRDVLGFFACAQVRIGDNVFINGQRCTDAQPTSAASAIAIEDCYDVAIGAATLEAEDVDTPDTDEVSGAGLFITRSSKVRFGGLNVSLYSFAISISDSLAPEWWPCVLHGMGSAGALAAGIRGLKLAGVKGARGDIGHVIGFSTGMKIDDSDRFDIAGTTWGCGLNGSHAVSVGGETSEDAEACLLGRLNVRINGTGAGGGYGVFVDTYCPNTEIIAKIFAATAGGLLCQSNHCKIDVEVKEWDSAGAHNIAAVTFAQGSDVRFKIISGAAADPDHHLKIAISTTGTFQRINAGTISGISLDNAWDPAAQPQLDLLTLIRGPLHVSGLPSIFYGSAAPVAGTYIVGDVQINTVPTAGGTEKWVCTTAGTPGTWKAVALAA